MQVSSFPVSSNHITYFEQLLENCSKYAQHMTPNGFLVSEETVVLGRWESETNELIKVELPSWKI